MIVTTKSEKEKKGMSSTGQSTIDWQNLTLIGLGSQGKAWLQNLRDSGRNLKVFLRNQESYSDYLHKNSLEVTTDLARSGVILLLIPDSQHISFLEEHARKLKKGTVIIYAHGVSLWENEFDQKFPHLNHCLLAPKAIASELRSSYLEKKGLGAVYSCQFTSKENSEQITADLLSLAKDLGITAGPYLVSFEEEAKADLLSEQSLLCGLMPFAAKYCFDKLIENGISPELAYLEAWHEVKLIGNAMSQYGPKEFFNLISPHALVGGYLASKELFDKEYHKTLDSLQKDIWNGRFFELVQENPADKVRETITMEWEESTLNKIHNQLSPKLKS